MKLSQNDPKVIQNQAGDYVASCYDAETARLFAAAPDLLAACEAAMMVFQRCVFTGGIPEALQAGQKLSDAISKAHGAPSCP